MWSNCPVECECNEYNLYLDVICKWSTTPGTTKKRKIAAKFINVPSPNSSVNDVNLAEFASDLHAPPPMSSSTVVEQPSSRQPVRPRRPLAVLIAPAQLPWTFTFSPKYDVPTLDETTCGCATCVKHMLDPAPSTAVIPSPFVLSSPVARPSTAAIPSPVVSSLPVACPQVVASPSAVVASSPQTAAFTAPFDTPDVGCFACSPWGQHGIGDCRQFVVELTPTQRQLLLTRQQHCFCCWEQQLDANKWHSGKECRVADCWCVTCQKSDHHTLLGWGKNGPRKFVTTRGGRVDKKTTAAN